LRTDVWIPLAMDRNVWGSNRLAERGTFWLNVLGRVRPGITTSEASADLNGLMERIAAVTPKIERGPDEITLDPLWRSAFRGNVCPFRPMPPLLALAAVLLLLACTNVANLLLVRLIGRRREIALRLAMGVSRAQLVRQLLTENLILGVIGGAAAMLFTTWTAGTLASFLPPSQQPLALNAHADRRVLLAAIAISMIAAMLSGILPALRRAALGPGVVLKEEEARVSGGLHRSRLSSALVVVQIAFALVLLVAAGLFTRSVQNEQRVSPGFDPGGVLLASYALAPSGYSRADG